MAIAKDWLDLDIYGAWELPMGMGDFPPFNRF